MRRHSHHNDPIDRAFDDLLAAALCDYRQKQEKLAAELAILSRWQWDLEACTIAFEGDGIEARTYAMTPIATYVPSTSNWHWAWGNTVIPEAARVRSARLRAIAEKTQYRIFDSPVFKATLEETDELCAMALRELGGRGVFKDKEGEPWLLLGLE